MGVAECAKYEKPDEVWCSLCMFAVVDEAYDNYVPTPGALGVCRRATFPDDAIVGRRSVIEVIRDEGFTLAEFFSEADLSAQCRVGCARNENTNEFFTVNRCVGGCVSCMIALAEEVWR